MSDNTFQLAESFFKRRKIVIGILMTAMPVFLLGATLLRTPEGSASAIWPILIGVILVVEVIMVTTASLTMKRVRQLRYVFQEKGIERISGGHRELFPYDDITKVLANYNPNGQLASVKVESPGKSLVAFQLNDMPAFLEQLSLRTSIPGGVTRKNLKVDWDGPLVWLGSFVVAGLVLAVFSSGGYFFREFGSSLIQAGLGFYFVFFNPISKAQGPRFRKFELIIGWLLMGMCVLQIGMKLLHLAR